mmetsp:Transcript_10568/g.20947  ORF Transcript_10568/g.20947 Transcript_10568/m.20947 type:complete len:282 (-) Transcript_10568:153-998(-)
MMAELGHDGLDSLVSFGIVFVVACSFEEGIVVMTVLIVSVVEGGDVFRLFGSRRRRRSSGVAVGTRRRWVVISGGHHIGGWLLKRMRLGKKRVDCSQRWVWVTSLWHLVRWWHGWIGRCWIFIIVVIVSVSIVVIVVVIGARRSNRILSWSRRRSRRNQRTHNLFFRLGNISDSAFRRFLRRRRSRRFGHLFLLFTTDSFVVVATKRLHPIWNLNLQTPLNHSGSIRRRCGWCIIELQCGSDEGDCRDDGKESKVGNNVFFSGNEHGSKDEGATDTKLVGV